MALLLAGGSLWLRPRAAQSIEPGVRYEDVAAAAGCRNEHTKVVLSPRLDNIGPWLASVGAAVAAADYDGDGHTDFYVVNSGRGTPNRLFRNRGDGTFEDVAARAGVACGNAVGACVHAVFGDVNGDARPDLYVAKWADRNQLFVNQGDGTFRDVTAAAGVGYWGYGNAATFLDYDRDGRLDLLVGNYFADSLADPRTGRRARSDLWDPVTTRVMHSTFTHADNGGKSVLYRNRGDGTFEDVAHQAGLRFRGWTLAAGAADLDQDGWPDLYLANDFGPDELYLSTGAAESPPRYRRVVDASGHPGVGDDWWKGMNVTFGDADGDGSLDVYVTNIRARRYKSDEGNMLWLNRAGPDGPGGRRFADVAARAGADDGGWGWGAQFLDANNDGLLDLFALNGFVTGDPSHTYWYALQEMVTQTKNNSADAADWPVMGNRDLSGGERSRLFLQLPRERAGALPRFADAAAEAGIVDEWNGRGVAVTDIDHDGVLDLYVANQGAPSLLYRGRLAAPAASRRWLGLALAGRPDQPVTVSGRALASTTEAVGARAELHTSAGVLVREVSGGWGFASQSERRLHFGVGDATVQRLVVQWPSGREQSFTGPALEACVGGYARLVEGGALEPGAGAGAPPAPAVAARESR